jgi:hypothetical protein
VRSRIQAVRFALVAMAVVVALLPGIARAQVVVKVNDDVGFRLGITIQAWADWQQNAAGQYAQNLFLRRARFLMTGTVAKDVSFFFQTDNPNVGKSTQTTTSGTTGVKNLSTGFILQDALVEWKIANEFRLDGGLFLVPLCRDCLTGVSSFLTLDISSNSTAANTVTQSSGTRDTGFGARGYLLDDHLEYRAAVFSGFRQPGANNSFRYSGRLQYDLLDTEVTSYIYSGNYRGTKKILALGVGTDNQGSFHAYSGDVYFDIPVAKGDAVTGQAAWIHYDGQQLFATLLQQNDYLAQLGYYLSALKTQPFGMYQTVRFSQSAKTSGNSDKWQAGFNFYIKGQNLKLTPAFTRVLPKLASAPATNEFTVQLQVTYY